MSAKSPSGPHFLGIGTQKGGTTLLHHLLSQRPDCYLPDRKEVHFFSTEYDRGECWYRNHFRQATAGQRRGEITPYYMFHPKAPQRIEAFDPELRLIALLRHPVDRAISHYHHARQRGFEQLPLREAIKAEQERLNTGDPWNLQKHSYIARSRYCIQLERFGHFQANGQLLLLKSEDLFSDPNACMAKLETFLQLAHHPVPEVIPASNKGSISVLAASNSDRHKLENLLRTEIRELGERYSIHWPKQHP